MSQSNKSLTAELTATKEKNSLIDTRSDSFESQLGANATSQSSRFDKFEQLISILTNAIVPQVNSSSPSPMLTSITPKAPQASFLQACTL
jgi:hypothetical protein